MNATNLTCFFLEVFLEQSSHWITVSIISCVLSSLFSLTAVLGNGTIMVVIFKTRELHSPSFVLLLFLAAADFLVGLAGQPSLAARQLAQLLGNFDVYCKLRMSQFFIGWITGSVSFITLSGVCIDRLLALTLHLRYKNMVTVPRVLTLIISVWIFCSIVTISKFWIRVNWIILPATILSVTTVMTTLGTFKIFQIAYKHQRQIQRENQTIGEVQTGAVDVLKCKKSAVTVLYVYGLLLAFYLPFIAVVVVESIQGVSNLVQLAYDLAATAVFINSSVNPVIYCWRMAQIRRAVKMYFKNLTCGLNFG